MAISDTKNESAVHQAVDLMEHVWGKILAFPPIFRPHVELTNTQVRTLVFLSEKERRIGDIAANLGISFPSASRFVQRLANKGLLERREDCNDRRVSICFLTDSGREVLRRLSDVMKEKIGAAIGFLSAEQIDQLICVMGMLDGLLPGRSHANESKENVSQNSQG